MKLIVFHRPSAQAFLMDLTMEQSAELTGLSNEDTQDVPFVDREIRRRFGDKPHFMEIGTLVCSLLNGVTMTDSVGQTTFTQIENEIEGNQAR